jgi:hypothetical protein
VANIDIGTLRKVKGVLVRRVATPGHLILSGILARDAEEVRRAYLETGAFASSRLDREDEWVSITFKKKRIVGSKGSEGSRVPGVKEEQNRQRLLFAGHLDPGKIGPCFVRFFCSAFPDTETDTHTVLFT